MKLLKNLTGYLLELTGNRIYPENLSQASQDKLPIFLSRTYSLYTANILGKVYLLLVHEGGDEPTPAKASTHANIVRDKLQVQAVFVFSRLKPFNRNRLIERGVPFIVPYQHVFLPHGLIDIREQSSRGSSIDRKLNTISAPAQVMLLYYFINAKQVAEWPLKKWSEELNYSQMSMSRAWKELAAKDLCEGQKRGRSLIPQFPRSNRRTWNLALPHLHNPIRHRMTAAIENSSRLQLLKAGLTALAELTLISGGDKAVYATALSTWRTAVEQKTVRKVSRADDSGVMIETWRYDPSVLSPEKERVDHLSLYLSLRDEPDERIQGALEEMIEEFPWQM